MTLQPEKRIRLNFLDLVKTVAIINICTLHFDWVGDMYFAPQMAILPFLRRFFFGAYAATVPLFMMANGALVLSRPFNAKKHFYRTLLLTGQYIFWRAVSIILIGLYQGVDFSQYNLTSLVNYLVFMKEFPGVTLHHLWFMPMLICVYIWVPIIKAAFDRMDEDKNGIWIFLPFMGLLLVFCFLLDDALLFQPAIPVFNAAFLHGLRIMQPLSSPLYSCMLFYFILGGLILRYEEQIRRIPNWALGLGLLVSVVLLYVEWKVNSNLMGETYDNVFASHENLPCALEAFCLFVLAMRCEGWLKGKEKLCSFLSAVGSNTLSVYYFHWIIASTVLEYLHFTDGFIFNCIKGFVLCLGCVGISLVLKKIPVVRRLMH